MRQLHPLNIPIRPKPYLQNLRLVTPYSVAEVCQCPRWYPASTLHDVTNPEVLDLKPLIFVVNL